MKLGFWTTLLAALVIVTGAHAQKISETLTDACSADVAFVPTYDSPNGVPGTVILSRAIFTERCRRRSRRRAKIAPDLLRRWQFSVPTASISCVASGPQSPRPVTRQQLASRTRRSHGRSPLHT